MVDERLTNGTRGLDDIAAFFPRGEEQIDPRPPQGSLAINTATEMRDPDTVLVELGVGHRAALHRGFTAALARAAELGEIEPDLVADHANDLVTAVLGLTVMLSGGASVEELRSHLGSILGSLHRS